MCLAEVGIDPQTAQPWGSDTPTINFNGLDHGIAWRAFTLASMATGKARIGCCECMVASSKILDDAERREVLNRCEAVLPLTEDCGIDRRPSSTGDSGR